MKQQSDPIKVAYDDWVELLKHTKNDSMLQDSYGVWLEAFHVGSIFTRNQILLPILNTAQRLHSIRLNYLSLPGTRNHRHIGRNYLWFTT